MKERRSKIYFLVGVLFPSAGGTYTYTKEAFGDCMGFYFLWSEILIRSPVAQAIKSLTFATYVLYPVFATCEPPAVAMKILAALLTCIVLLILSYKLRLGVAVTVLMTLSKLGAMLVIICAGAIEIGKGIHV